MSSKSERVLNALMKCTEPYEVPIMTRGTLEVKIDAKFLTEELLNDVEIKDGVIVGYKQRN